MHRAAPRCDLGEVISPPCSFLPLCPACPTSSCDRPQKTCCVFGTYRSFLVPQQPRPFVKYSFFPAAPLPSSVPG